MRSRIYKACEVEPGTMATSALAQAKQGPPPGAPVKILYAEVYEVVAQA